MNYVVFDLEFNQAWDMDESQITADSKCPFEIVQIGALKLDEKLQVISTFNTLVKPELYKEIHPFVKQITGITTESLATSKTFKEVFEDFTKLLDEESILCVWGANDIKELIRNVRFYRLDISGIPKEFINIQKYASKALNCPKGSNTSLRNAVEILNIPLDSKFHDAFNDAYYTAEVFKYIYNENIKPSFYSSNEERRFNRPIKKSRLDTEKLIKQFEKMYSREMTEEEKAIIKLAYLMGRTNQFQIEGYAI